MSKIDSELKRVFSAARARIEQYGVRVSIEDVLDPNTGTFDGAKIGIDYANDLEMSLFVLVHLFGHTAQWNTVPAYRSIDARVKPGAAAEIIEEARVYERNASRLGLSLLHEAAVGDRDQWLSDWCASDWSYLSTYYATGKLPHWEGCRSTGHPLLEAMPIPAFTPQRFQARYAF